MLATLAGRGLRIEEALALVDITKGTVWVGRSRTDAGVRTVDLTPALRDELTTYLERSPWKQPSDGYFRRWPASLTADRTCGSGYCSPRIKRANTKVLELGIEPIGNVTLHGLRRTHASLRCAVGDDQAFTASQIGHDDPAFTMRVFTHAVKRRQRLSGAEVEAFTLANRVGAMGTFGRK